jgi:hypothetical protein
MSNLKDVILTDAGGGLFDVEIVQFADQVKRNPNDLRSRHQKGLTIDEVKILVVGRMRAVEENLRRLRYEIGLEQEAKDLLTAIDAKLKGVNQDKGFLDEEMARLLKQINGNWRVKVGTAKRRGGG